MHEENLKNLVKERYGKAAIAVRRGSATCCSSGSLPGDCDPITGNLYDAAEAEAVPREAMLASLGCGNPTALAELHEGEVVLDLGSGGGIDVILSARRVGPTGKAYGLDMTDQMLSLARENQRRAGVENVEFLKGEIEQIPLPDSSVDVIISNCVINLSGEKDRVFREAFRVLKPGGRFAVSDVVSRGDIPPAIRGHLELWAGCIAGSLDEAEYHEKLAAAGFEEIGLEATRIYRAEDAMGFLSNAGIDDLERVAADIEGKFFSAFVRAKKPAEIRKKEGTEQAMRTLHVYDPAMCCSTGVCGPEPDPVLPRFAADFHWLANQGVQVERYNLAQQPQAFAASELVKEALAQYGVECLPLVVVNNAIMSRGRYPERHELARFVGLRVEESVSLYSEAVAELVAIGAAIASNCEPCFQYHFDKARKLGVSREDMLSAVETAQKVKESPAASVLELAKRILKPDSTPEVKPVDLPVMASACCSPTDGTSGQNGGCC